MSRLRRQLPLLAVAAACIARGEEVVVNFEKAALLKPNSDEALRIEQWVEQDVTFKLAHEPRQSKAKGLVMFFEHLSNGHKGLACAMALEPIPVLATLPRPASRVTVAFWGSTGTPALLEALDAEGNVVDRASLPSVPGRKTPGEPVPIFTMSVSAPRIAAIQFSGPRQGEYLAADEVRVTFTSETSPAAP